MSSYESDIKDRLERGQKLPEKLHFSILNYLWRTGPFSGNDPENVPRFLRQLLIFKSLTDNELRVLSNYFHRRKFLPQEAIFEQYDTGIGFYVLFRGSAEVVVRDEVSDGRASASLNADGLRYIVTLAQGDYFGELALLQDVSLRSATVRAVDNCEALGLFVPDLEEMLLEHPTVAAKLIKALSTIITHRLYSITKEIGDLKIRMAKQERENEEFKQNRS